MAKISAREVITEDINDIFDSLLLTEENLTEEGYSQGFEKGVEFGNLEGYHLGYHRGAELGAEIGFYSGVIEVLMKLEKTIKAEKAITLLASTIKSFPQDNDESIDIFQLSNKIRAQYKKVATIFKINSGYPETSDLSF